MHKKTIRNKRKKSTLYKEEYEQIKRNKKRETIDLVNIDFLNRSYDSVNENIRSSLNSSELTYSGRTNTSIIFLLDFRTTERNIIEYCQKHSIVYDDIFKIKLNFSPDEQIKYEIIEEIQNKLKNVIELIKPKLIVTFGEVSLNIIRYINNSSILKGNKINGESIMDNEYHYFKYKDKLRFIYNSRSNKFAYLNFETKFSAYVLSFYKSDSNHTYEEDFLKIINILKLNKLEWFDEKKYIDNQLDYDKYDHINYNSPNDIFYQNPYYIRNDQIFNNFENNQLITDIKTVDYDSYSNCMYMRGRMLDSTPICLKVICLEFCFYIKTSNDNIDDEYLKKLKNEIINILQFKDIDHDNFILNLEKYRGRNDFKYEKYKSDMIKVIYNNYTNLRIIKESIETALCSSFETCEFYETFPQAKENFMIHNNICMNGWILINKENLKQLIGKKKISRGCYDFIIKPKDIISKIPNEEDESNKRFNIYAPTKYLSIDYEMLSSAVFPTPESSPIISMCATLYSVNDGKDKIKGLEKKDEYEMKSTGQIEAEGSFIFALGKLDKQNSSYNKFNRKMLPNIPLPKSKLVNDIFQSRKINDKEKFENHLKELDNYISKLYQWYELVGSFRANQMYEGFENFIESLKEPLGYDYKKRIIKTIKILKNIKLKLKKTKITDFEDHISWRLLIKDNNNPSNEIIKKLGLLQCNHKKLFESMSVYCFETESDLIRGFENFRIQTNYDVLTGYNIDNFDEKYLDSRKRILGIYNKRKQIFSSSCIKHLQVRAVTQNKSSTATGDRVYTEIKVPGRTVFDCLNWAMRELKERSYTLNYVSNKLLNSSKIDLPYDAISYTFKENREILNVYCWWDTVLPFSLLMVRGVVDFTLALSRMVTTMSIGDIYSSGQQKKIIMIYLKHLKNYGLNQLIPDYNQFNQFNYETPAAGAYVFPLTPGMSFFVSCLDFQSLYPSIMITYNLSHNVMGNYDDIIRWGFNPETDCFKTVSKYVSHKTNQTSDVEYYYFLKPLAYTIIEIKEKGFDFNECEPKLNIKGDHEVNENGELLYIPKILRGSIPTMVDKILIARKKVKKIQSIFKYGSNEWKSAEGKQLALKIIANSVYGGTGDPNSRIYARQIQETITLKGQIHIKATADLVVNKYSEYGPKIVGGDTDSIFPTFEFVKKIDDLFKPIEKYNELSKKIETKPFIEHVTDTCNSILPSTMKLEFEAVYLNFFPAIKTDCVKNGKNETAKKKVACKKIEPTYDWNNKKWDYNKKPEIFFKGLEAKRRDSPVIVQEIMSNFFYTLYEYDDYEIGKQKSIEYLKNQIDKLREGKTNISKLILSKQLAASYKTKPSHVFLVEKKLKRGEEAPVPGTRIPYVLITGYENKKSKLIEDPIYVIKNNLQIDIVEYIWKVRKAMARFLIQFVDGDTIFERLENFEKLEESIYGVLRDTSKVDLKKRLAKPSTDMLPKNLRDDFVLKSILVQNRYCINCNKKLNTNMINYRLYTNNLCDHCKLQNILKENILQIYYKEELNLKDKKEKVLNTCRACFKIESKIEIKCNNVYCEKNYHNKILAETSLINHQNKIKDIEDLI